MMMDFGSHISATRLEASEVVKILRVSKNTEEALSALAPVKIHKSVFDR